jgi:thioredoxin 1
MMIYQDHESSYGFVTLQRNKRISVKFKENKMASVNVSDADFENEVLKSDEPVMVDFWAEWCGPCKALSPIVDEVANEVSGKMKVVKVNIDENPNAPTKYGVRGIPTLMVFKGGELVDTKVGGMSKTQLNDWLNSVI